MNAPTPAAALNPAPSGGPAIGTLGTALEAAIEAGAVDLPLLPETAMKVFRLAQDPDADMKEVSELIERDQKMASHVLRVVNSAAYSPKTEIVTLRQAVARLGLKPLSEIVIASAFKASVFEDERFIDHLQQYWQEGIGCALWNKELARLRRQNVETAYLCGLLHNIGKPVVLKFVSEQLGEQADPDQVVEAVNVLSPAIGEQLARSWNLPAPVQVAIRWHGDYEKAQDYRDEAAAVHASLLITAQTFETDESAVREALAGKPAFQLLNVYPEDVDKLLGKRERMALQLESFQ